MSRKKQVYEKITALYCRISLDDGGDNESMSISNQKLMLRDFAEKHGMFQYEYYVDEGYTGRNFNRPSFQRMIADIEAGKIGCVITKDLSRLGRNYIEAGSYIEIFFPKHNVRYIAVTDGVDSLTRQEMDITPFKNILNDMYSRDISKKVLAGRMTRSRQGKFCGGQPPLGLMRDPEDKGHLILDPETAPVIRKIYDMALDGWGCMRIAKQLMDDKIPITRVKSNTECDVNYYSWGSARISHILRNPFYKGAHLVCRTHQKGIRSNTYDIIPREDWEVIEGCHEAIVTPEEWEQVQEIIDRRPTIMKGNACPFYNLFHGLVYCATCGKSMQVRYEKVGRTGKNRFTGEMREPIDKAYYICQTYNRLGKNACTSHKIEARDLYNLVLKDIQELAAQAMKDADAFYQRLSSRMECRYLVDASQTEKERKRLEVRNQEIDGMFLSLYTDKAKGILTEQRFMKLTAALEQEQEANQKRLHDLAVMQSRADAQESEVRTFIKEIRRYAAIEELDESVLNRLISKILIGEVKKVDGQKVRHDQVHNLYGGSMTRAAGEAFADLRPGQRTLLYSRSSFIGSHRYGGIWLGDNNSSWAQLLANIQMMPSVQMCGFLYSGADLCGFSCDTTPDLALRWLEFGLLTPLMRNHSAVGTRMQEYYRFPEVLPAVRNMIRLRYALLPYLYSEFMKAALENTSYFRPLAFDYPDDPDAREVEDQLLLGEGLMAAPVYVQNAHGRHVYLPEPMKLLRLRAVDDYDEEILPAGHHYIRCALDEMLLFIRPGHIIPVAQPANNTAELDDASLTLWSFLPNGESAEYRMYRDDGVTTEYEKKEHWKTLQIHHS